MVKLKLGRNWIKVQKCYVQKRCFTEHCTIGSLINLQRYCYLGRDLSSQLWFKGYTGEEFETDIRDSTAGEQNIYDDELYDTCVKNQFVIVINFRFL